MILIPLPAEFDTAGRDPGSTFDVTATVTMADGGLQVTAIDGLPVAAETEEAEDMEMEMDDDALATALEGGMG
ncbi:MAG TPA: hypothetical protein PKZ19_15975 [Zoogloea sp.]|nr:hypothetical protein [Zoogloea sp.]